MAARIRAIIERIKQEPGWLLVLLGLLTLYVTYKLYQRYVGGGQDTGAYVPSNGIDVPLYPGSVGGTPGNPGGSPTTAPGGLATDYGQQLQDLLNALGGNGVVPSIPTYTSDGGTTTPSSTTTQPAQPKASGSKGPDIFQQLLSAALNVPKQVAAQYKAAGSPGSPAPKTPKQTVADNPALWAQPSTTTKPPKASVGDNPSLWAQSIPTSVPGAASSSAQKHHQNEDLGF